MPRAVGRGLGQRPADIVGSVRALVAPLLADRELDLVEVEFQRETRGWILRLYIDRPGGVTLDDCQKVSQELGDHLDVADLIDYPYHLEVSSPGLDRPLTRDADFIRFAGKAARVVTRDPVEGQRNFRGRLAGLVDGMVLLNLADGRQVQLPRQLIAKARLEVEL